MCIRDSVYCAFNGSITIGNIELYTGYALIAADAFSSGPVSYTHLDVYKRQAFMT